MQPSLGSGLPKPVGRRAGRTRCGLGARHWELGCWRLMAPVAVKLVTIFFPMSRLCNNSKS